MDVGRSPRIVVISPRIGARPNGDIAIVTLVIGHAPACTGKVRVERCVPMVLGMDVTTSGIRLPDLDYCIGYRPAILVEHAARYDNPLALGNTRVLTGEIGERASH